MHKKIFTLFLGWLFMCNVTEAQNLILNPSLEQHSACPSYLAQFNLVLDWLNPSTNVLGSTGSPDYFNECATNPMVGVPSNNNGYQYAHTGTAYALIATYLNGNSDFREYLEATFSSPLIAGEVYHFEMYVNLNNNSEYATDDFGVYFTNVAITGVNNHYHLPYTPQIVNSIGIVTDTLNWTLIEGDYTATGGESYLIIGNFNDDASSTNVIVNSAGLSQTAYFIDDVSLTLVTGINDLTGNTDVTLYPNPFTEELSVKTTVNEPLEIVLYDVASRELIRQDFTIAITLNTEQLAKGVYIYEVRSKSGVVKKGKIVKN